MEDQRISHLNIRIRHHARHHAGMGHRDYQHGQRDDKSGDRPRDSDIKQRAAGTDGRAYANDRAQRSNQSRRGNEEGKRGVHAVVAAVQVVSHLVRQKNQQQRGREGNSQQQARRFVQAPSPRETAAEFRLHEQTAAHCCRKSNSIFAPTTSVVKIVATNNRMCSQYLGLGGRTTYTSAGRVLGRRSGK